MKNLLLALLTLTCLGLSYLAWSEHRELSELRALKDAGHAESDATQKRLAAAQNNVRELERQLDELRNGTKTSGKTALVVPQLGDGAGLGWMSGLASFMDRPEMQRMMAAQQRLQVERRFARLFKQLNLPPEQLEKLKSLLVEQQTAAMDTFIVGAQKGLNPLLNEAELNKLVKDAQGDVDKQIKDLLGTDSFSQYESYKKQEPQRAIVGQLQQNLGYDDEPLNREQSDRLAEVLASTSGANGGRSGAISEEAINQSRTFLSAGQTKALQDLRQQQLDQAELRKKLLPRPQAGGTP